MMMKISDSTPADHQVYCNTHMGYHRGTIFYSPI